MTCPFWVPANRADNVALSTAAITGRPIKTLLRGAFSADNGEIIGDPGMGQFQPRQTTQSWESA
jgi:hypothetical protein